MWSAAKGVMMLAVRLRLIVGALICLSPALGCDCAPTSVHQAKKWADIVFRGTITDIANGRVRFRVDRVWKGDVPRFFEMVEFREAAACVGFWPTHLKIGNSLLVYAEWRPPRSPDGLYLTNICTRTALVKDAQEDIDQLGSGRSPRKYPAHK